MAVTIRYNDWFDEISEEEYSELIDVVLRNPSIAKEIGVKVKDNDLYCGGKLIAFKTVSLEGEICHCILNEKEFRSLEEISFLL